MREWSERHIRELIKQELKNISTGGFTALALGRYDFLNVNGGFNTNASHLYVTPNGDKVHVEMTSLSLGSTSAVICKFCFPFPTYNGYEIAKENLFTVPDYLTCMTDDESEPEMLELYNETGEEQTISISYDYDPATGQISNIVV